MELDGFCEELGVAFEHQGEQHFRKVEHFNRREETLDLRKKDDERKRSLCKKQGIKLIEVPYSVPAEDLKIWISDALAKFGGLSKATQLVVAKTSSFEPSNELRDLQLLAQSRGGDCLSQVYKGVVEKHEFICGKGHKWSASPSSIKSGSWCPVCKPERIANSKRKHSLSTMVALAASKGGKFLSNEFKSVNEKYEWECKEKHKWYAAPVDVMKGRWCRICSTNRQRGSLEEMQLIARKRKGFCLSSAYEGSAKPLRWKCQFGHEWMARPGNVKNSSSWCPVCARK